MCILHTGITLRCVKFGKNNINNVFLICQKATISECVDQLGSGAKTSKYDINWLYAGIWHFIRGKMIKITSPLQSAWKCVKLSNAASPVLNFSTRYPYNNQWGFKSETKDFERVREGEPQWKLETHFTIRTLAISDNRLDKKVRVTWVATTAVLLKVTFISCRQYILQGDLWKRDPEEDRA